MYTSPYIVTTPVVISALRGVVPSCVCHACSARPGGAFRDLGWWTLHAVVERMDGTCGTRLEPTPVKPASTRPEEL